MRKHWRAICNQYARGVLGDIGAASAGTGFIIAAHFTGPRWLNTAKKAWAHADPGLCRSPFLLKLKDNSSWRPKPATRRDRRQRRQAGATRKRLERMLLAQTSGAFPGVLMWTCHTSSGLLLEGRGRGVKRGRPGLDWLQGRRKRRSYIEMFILGQHPGAPQAEMRSSSGTRDLNPYHTLKD